MQSATSSVASKYQHSQVTHADPVQLIILLYDGALSRIAQAKQRFQDGDILQAGLSVTKAQAIVGELRKSLNMEAGQDIAANLDRLYAYLHDLLVRTVVKSDAEPLDEAVQLLTELKTAWTEVAKQAQEYFEKERLAAQSGARSTSTLASAGFQAKV